MAEALAALPPDLTVVLVAREQPPKRGRRRRSPTRWRSGRRAGAALRGAQAARAARLARRRGGQRAASRSSPTPRGCSPSGWGTGRRGWRPSSTGSRSGRARGGGDARGPRGDGRRHLRGGRLGAVGRDRRPRSGRRAVAAAERLADQGEAVTPLIYQAAKRLREANARAGDARAGTVARRRSSRRCRCIPTRRRCSCGGCATARAARSGPRRARSPTSSGGRGAARTIPSAWR